MNPGPILALISDLYAQVSELAHENQQLREALEAAQDQQGS
ncbi:hypothetical protein FB556_2167 [Enteractinococcus coprophilus]|uniref:Uncharacterized protein n=1 Tax=Enteractinococcus coprophilus TaxID=1027633 RepID=A0A543AGG2_9MICC|nr:hypothetical protein FB556_2167 [Enteractinococcus coprophilus]